MQLSTSSKSDDDLKFSSPSKEWKKLWEGWAKEILTSKFLTIFEPERKSIAGIRIGQARFISGKLAKSPDDSFVRFPTSCGRHTTLAGIWMFLGQDHRNEYLVTAFGRRKGRGLNRPAQFYGLHISYGTKHAVHFSPSCIDYFQKHLNEISNSEVLICHNHPDNFITDLLSQIVDWSPLPSNTDRETMFQFKYRSIVRWLISGDFQNLRFFLFEKGRLRECQLPTAKRLVEIVRATAYFGNESA